MIDTTIKKRTKGRPRSFDKNTALEQAKEVFWQYGYQNTSLAQLTSAMAMNPPSLYAAFGDKETLFIEVLDWYYKPYATAAAALFAQETDTHTTMLNFLQMNLQWHLEHLGIGCLVVNSTIQCHQENHTISSKIKAIHDNNEALITQRLAQGQQCGDIAVTLNIQALARFINGQIQGAAVLSRGQRSSEAVKDMFAQATLAVTSLISTQ